mmetsp:Transcript_4471/g.11210  ORF Transcript_4471/g.11210 Transcript_4471/m.11210 type:complete len:904 (-) Transcript_4471:1022-3733(-)
MAPKQQEQQLLEASTMMTMMSKDNNRSGRSSSRGSGNGSVFDCPTAASTASSRSSSTSSDHHHHPRTIIATTASSTGAGSSSPSTAMLTISPLSPYSNDDHKEEHELEEGNDAPPQSEDDQHQLHHHSHSHTHGCCTSPTTVMTRSSPSGSSATSCPATNNASSGTNTAKKKKKQVVVGTTGEVVLVPGTPTGTNHDGQQLRRQQQQQQQQKPQQDDGGKANLRNNKPRPQKPFFVFDDWLDELVPKDQTAAEQLAELLQTPQKQRPATPAAGNVPRTTTKSQRRLQQQHEQQQQRLSPIIQFFFERFHRSDDRVHGSNIFATSRAANQSGRGRDTGGTKKHQDGDDHHQRRISSEPMLSSMKHGRGRNNNGGDDDDDGFDDDGSVHSSPSPALKVQQMPSTPKSSNKRRSILRRRRQYHHRRRQQQPQQVDPEQDQHDDDEDYYCEDNSGGDGDGDGDGDGEDQYNFYFESPIGALPAPTKLEEQLDLASLDHHQAQQAAPPGVPILDLGSSSSMSTREEDEELQRRHRNHLLRRRHRQKNPCIVRRSLELAQAWNLKGLHKAREASCSAEENSNGPSSSRRSWEDALAAWNNALEIITALLGKKHVQYAMIQNNRGIALGRLELYDEAFEALSVALEIRQSRLVVGRAVNNGTVSERNGAGAVQTEQQQQLQRCAGEDCDSVSTTNIRLTTNNTSTFEEVVSTLHNLANVYQAKGDLPTALSVLGYARGLCFDAIEAENGKTAPGSTEVASASTYSLQSARLCVAMGHVYWEASQYDDAHDAYQDAMQLYEHLAAETTRRNIINSRRYSSSNNNNNNNNQAIEESQPYELITAELQSLRVDIQELQGLREQQHCNYQEQLMRQHQLEGQCHQTSSAGNFVPIQDYSQHHYEQNQHMPRIHR